MPTATDPTRKTQAYGRWHTLLALVRAPTPITAATDVLAGVAVVWPTRFVAARDQLDRLTFDLMTLACVALASACLYAAGMALNDAFDAPRDRAAGRARPIVLGLITRRRASLVGAGLIAVALLALGGAAATPPAGFTRAGLASARTGALFLVGGLLAAAVVAYDAQANKERPTGVALMTLCRVLNLLLGAVAVSTEPLALLGLTGGMLSSGSVLLGVALGSLALYILGITVISTLEDRPEALGIRARLATAAGLIGLALVAPMVAGIGYGLGSLSGAAAAWRGGPAGETYATLAETAIGLLVPGLAIMLLVLLARPLAAAWRAPSRAAFGGVVRAGVLGVILFDAMLAALAGWWVLALGMAALWYPTRRVARGLGRRLAAFARASGALQPELND